MDLSIQKNSKGSPVRSIFDPKQRITGKKYFFQESTNLDIYIDIFIWKTHRYEFSVSIQIRYIYIHQYTKNLIGRRLLLTQFLLNSSLTLVSHILIDLGVAPHTYFSKLTATMLVPYTSALAFPVALTGFFSGVVTVIRVNNRSPDSNFQRISYVCIIYQLLKSIETRVLSVQG